MTYKLVDRPVHRADDASRRTVPGTGSDLAGDRCGVLRERQRTGLCRCTQVRGRQADQNSTDGRDGDGFPRHAHGGEDAGRHPRALLGHHTDRQGIHQAPRQAIADADQQHGDRHRPQAPVRRQAHQQPGAERGDARPADLAQHACLGFSRLASHPFWHLRDGDKATAIRIAGPLVTDDAQSLVQAAVSGAGIAMVSDWLAGPELCSGRLVPVLPDHPVENNETVYLVHPSARLVPAKTRAFADWIVGELGTRPWLSQASAD
ncbi:TPA: substrate binding domain-containing protein [Pseudomonas aeruginosa]|nr:substrate binding domain-containing protein [Pseudomonas aeruginosa]